MSQLKKDIEAIYILEPHYSRLRRQAEGPYGGYLENEDNVFWERTWRTLKSVCERVAKEIAEPISTDGPEWGKCPWPAPKRISNRRSLKRWINC